MLSCEWAVEECTDLGPYCVWGEVHPPTVAIRASIKLDNQPWRQVHNRLYKTIKSIDYRIRQICRLPLFFCSPPVPDGNLPAQSRCRHGISSFLRISLLIDLAKFSYIWTMIPQLKTLEYNVKGDVSIEGQKVASKKKIPHIVWKIFQMLPSQMFFLAGHCGQLQLHREGPWCFLLCGNKRVNFETNTLIV